MMKSRESFTEWRKISGGRTRQTTIRTVLFGLRTSFFLPKNVRLEIGTTHCGVSLHTSWIIFECVKIRAECSKYLRQHCPDHNASGTDHEGRCLFEEIEAQYHRDNNVEKLLELLEKNAL